MTNIIASPYSDAWDRQEALEQRVADEALRLLAQPDQLALLIGEQSDTAWWDRHDKLLSELLSCPTDSVIAAREAMVEHIMPVLIRHITITTCPED